MKNPYEHPVAIGNGLLVALVCFFALVGCRSSRSAVSESHHEESSVRHELSVENNSVDSTSSTVQKVDSVAGSAKDFGVVTIERDSMGLPREIYWLRFMDFSSSRGWAESSKESARFSSSMRCSAAADSVSSSVDKSTQTETDVSPGIAMENIIGPILILLVILYIGYVIIDSSLLPWLKTLKK